MERFQSQQETWLGFDPLVTPVEGVSIHRNTRLGETLSIGGNTIVYYMLLTPRRSRRPSINNGAAAPPRGSEVQAWRELPLRQTLPCSEALGFQLLPARRDLFCPWLLRAMRACKGRFGVLCCKRGRREARLLLLPLNCLP